MAKWDGIGSKIGSIAFKRANPVGVKMCIRDRTKKALEKYPVKTLVVAGGVAANQGLRERLASEITDVKAVSYTHLDVYKRQGLDIGPKSIAKFDQELTGAKTVVWNGPMGVFENPDLDVYKRQLEYFAKIAK